ncbi:SDR family NAD(P)-dependent oxidoreductase [Amycolatopsis pithecellobii]|uniref:SDR family NAD(P)-dependent oxidoreductase n=1 Tax=Amycolatopsis pithecellobii TaxID=664692 RepID=A0A6N7Z6R1_9PSEU|nr:SDR family oxidoreductase [Amycolatopsis pithecellobii]MTD57659.1 SDR family NAD(P)-dependent oxidoreductase [Amycolatopsis pithecellobii]
MTTALVTGATSGLGKEFARQLARERYDLVLVARDEARLHTAAAELSRQHGISAAVLPADLSTTEGRAIVEGRLAGEPVDLLINNAGIGLGKDFRDASPDELQRQLDINVTAVLRLTRAALPAMIERGSGEILNVSSVAGFFPGSPYSASKAWVTSFTEGVAAEVPPGVRITALCPGFVHTEFHQRAGVSISAPAMFWFTPARIVTEGLADLRRGKVVSIPGAHYKTIVALGRLVPHRLVRWLSRRV